MVRTAVATRGLRLHRAERTEDEATRQALERPKGSLRSAPGSGGAVAEYDVTM